MSAIYWDFTYMQHWCWVCSGIFQWTKMNEYKLRWLIDDRSAQGGKNTERHKTIHRTRKEFTRFQWYKMKNMNFYRLTKRQIVTIGRKIRRQKYDEWDSGNIQTTSKLNYLDLKRGGWGGGAVSSRSFDLLKLMIYDLKLSVDLKWLFDPVLHSSLDDLVPMLSESFSLRW